MKTRVARVRRRGTFLVARTLVRLCGFDRCRSLGAVFGAWQYRLGVFKRRRCLADLAVLLGRAPGDPEVERTLRNAYRVNTMCSLEVVSMADRKLDARRLRECCRVDGIGNLEAARDGRGAILLANHACNSLLLLAQLAEAGWPITVVYRRSPMMPESFVEEGLRQYGFEGIPANGGFRAYAGMVDAVRRNRVLFAMMDHGTRKARSGVRMKFLGKVMPMPGGVVQLARQTRAPIVPVTALASDPVWHFNIEPQLPLVPGGSIEEDVAVVLEYVERQILSHPELWSWPHRRWCDYSMAAAG